MTDSAARSSDQDSGNLERTPDVYDSNKQEASSSGMSTILFHAFETANRHKFPIIGASVAGILGGLSIALLTSPQYRASSRLEFGVQTSEVLPRGPGEGGVDSIIYDRTAVDLLRARSLAEMVVRDLNLANLPAVVDQSLPKGTREKVAAGIVLQGTGVEPKQQTRLVDVTFSFGEPELAARIANSLAENFIQTSLDRQTEKTRFLRKYLEAQLQTTRDRLEQSERDMLSFERAKDIVTLQETDKNGSPTSQSISNLQLKSVAAAYAEAQTKRIVAEQEYRKLSSAPVDDRAAGGIYDSLVELRRKEAELSKTFLPDYPELAAVRAEIQSLQSNIAPTENRVSSKVVGTLRAKYQAALGEEEQLKRALDKLKSTVLDERGDSARYTILLRDVDTYRELYNALLEQYKKVGAIGEVGDSTIAIVDRAQVPGAPYWPNIPLNIIAGLILGSLLGFLGAFLYDLLHEKIVRPSDIEERLKLKSLGAVPDAGDSESIADLLEDPKSSVTEAYLNVTNLLRLSTKHGVPQTLLVTSTIPEEGKSSSSYGLAKSLMKSGKRVLLIDADLRKPTFRVEGKADAGGLSNLLTGEISVDQAIVEGGDGLSYILSGGRPPNPSELFSTAGIEKLIDELRSRFDVVIFDAPPILALVDAPALAARCEATLLVIQSDRVRVSHAQQSVATLRNAGAHIVGALLTKYDAARDSYSYNYGYGSGYEYSYGAEPELRNDDKTSRRMIVARSGPSRPLL